MANIQAEQVKRYVKDYGWKRSISVKIDAKIGWVIFIYKVDDKVPSGVRWAYIQENGAAIATVTPRKNVGVM